MLKYYNYHAIHYLYKFKTNKFNKHLLQDIIIMSCCFGGDRKKPDVNKHTKPVSEVASNRSNNTKKSMILTDGKMKGKVVYNT